MTAPAVLSSSMDGYAGTGVLVESSSVTFGPEGGVPLAVAVLFTVPASTSAWVSTYAAAVQVVLAPGSRVLAAQVTVPTFGSVTPTVVRVTVPMLVTLNV